ncbi:MAG: XRE family transcriptional regulator [Candidatus Omnitrophica bacterium]|jgi:transcriptional regulator with XRE-family HTH domain|nr:XRE family transcriptional regulator [Candidatus Omnitrophota bacterium]
MAEALKEKLKKLRQEKKISRQQLYEKLKAIFADKAIKPNSIWRIEQGLTRARISSLEQLCVGLGVSLKDILPPLSQETKLAQIIRKKERINRYNYNKNSRIDMISSDTLDFLCQELTLSKKESTPAEEDPLQLGRFFKWVYCLRGKITCAVGAEKHNLAKGDCLSFESNIKHYFQNNSDKTSMLLIVQYPKHI